MSPARRRRGVLIRDDATLFRRARLQLTAWYALTLMVIVLGFGLLHPQDRAGHRRGPVVGVKLDGIGTRR